MNARELLIRIRTMFDGKGVEDSTKSVENLGKKTTEVGQSSEQAMNLMGTAAAAASGNFEGVAAGVVRLTGKIKLLGMSMMQLSLVAAVLTLLVKLFQAIGERADAMAAGLRQIKSDNVTAAIDRINKSYEDMSDAADRAMKAREASFAVGAEEVESIRKIELATLSLAKAKALALAKTPEEKANIEAQFKASESATNQKYDSYQSTGKRELALSQAAKAEEALQATIAQRDELMGQLPNRSREAGYAQGELMKAAKNFTPMGNLLALGAAPKRYEDAKEEADKTLKAQGDLIDSIKALNESIEAQKTEVVNAKTRATAVSNEPIATALTYEAEGVTAATAARDRAAATAAAAKKKRMEEELDAAEERKAATVESRSETRQRLTFRASTEAAEAKSAQAARSPLARKEQAEARAAAQAVADYAKETTAILKNLEGLMKAQRDALKRLPN